MHQTSEFMLEPFRWLGASAPGRIALLNLADFGIDGKGVEGCDAVFPRRSRSAAGCYIFPSLVLPCRASRPHPLGLLRATLRERLAEQA
jgi:hypothetical protein